MSNAARQWEVEESPETVAPKLRVIEGGAAAAEPTVHPKTGVASLVAGGVGMIAWIIPIFGLPLAATGLFYGIRSVKATRSTAGLIGTLLSSLGLLLALANSIVGAYLGATGRLSVH